MQWACLGRTEPYTVGAFVMSGWARSPRAAWETSGRRVMMVIFFLGLVRGRPGGGAAQRPCHARGRANHHGSVRSITSVGSRIVQHSTRPVSHRAQRLAGNLGIAFAAILTGFLVQQADGAWPSRCPPCVLIACGITFALVVPREEMPREEAQAPWTCRPHSWRGSSS